MRHTNGKVSTVNFEKRGVTGGFEDRFEVGDGLLEQVQCRIKLHNYVRHNITTPVRTSSKISKLAGVIIILHNATRAFSPPLSC